MSVWNDVEVYYASS